jgi:hypothetical protein
LGFFQIKQLIIEKTFYADEIRQERLDDAITKLDCLLKDSTVERTWDTLGATVAHYRLHSAFDYLIQAIFAYNRRWRTLSSRELANLKNMKWLPKKFNEQLLMLTNALMETKEGYMERAKSLKHCFDELVAICQHDGMYRDRAVSEALIRL